MGDLGVYKGEKYLSWFLEDEFPKFAVKRKIHFLIFYSFPTPAPEWCHYNWMRNLAVRHKLLEFGEVILALPRFIKFVRSGKEMKEGMEQKTSLG